MQQLKIYIDRVKNEQILKIKEILSPDFLDIHEEDLAFKDPVLLEGEAYLADEHLVTRLSIRTIATLPCSICNTNVAVPIVIKDLYSTHPLDEIKETTFDLEEEVRENILLQTPLFIECSEGNCPERGQIEAFLKPDGSSQEPTSKNFPFADLD